jgi:hypothetical protein
LGVLTQFHKTQHGRDEHAPLWPGSHADQGGQGREEFQLVEHLLLGWSLRFGRDQLVEFLDVPIGPERQSIEPIGDGNDPLGR